MAVCANCGVIGGGLIYRIKKAEVLLKFDDGFASEDITAARIRVALPEATLITHKPNGEQVGF